MECSISISMRATRIIILLATIVLITILAHDNLDELKRIANQSHSSQDVRDTIASVIMISIFAFIGITSKPKQQQKNPN